MLTQTSSHSKRNISAHTLLIYDLYKTDAPLKTLEKAVFASLGSKGIPLRISVLGKEKTGYPCEVEALFSSEPQDLKAIESIFQFRPRQLERTHAFNAVMLIPTGVDCAIGGHAGDATPAARLLAAVCDHLIVHPNVVNASDLNEQTENCLYTEGSLICRLLMGTIALQKIRHNRLLLVTESRSDCPLILDNIINCAEGARASFGINMSEVVVLEKPLAMSVHVSASGRMTGHLSDLEPLVDLLKEKKETFDAVALATKISEEQVAELRDIYYTQGCPNPWGGVEAAFTHFISTLLNVPSAHAPALASWDLLSKSWGRIDPRKAAEVISQTFLFCVLKGLHRAPRVIPHPSGAYDPSLISAEDISCLVIPDGCVGLPTLAACEQGIPVIAVKNNTNLMKNDLRELPFKEGQLHYAQNYYEAAGIIAAMKAGVPPTVLKRPLPPLIAVNRV